MRSIRHYLLTRLLVGAALVIATAGTAVYFVVTRSLQSQFDTNLANRAQGMLSLVFQTAERVEFEFSGELMPEYERAERPDYFQLWFEDGTLLEKSEPLEEIGADLVVQGQPTEVPVHWSAALPDGRPGRYVAQVMEVHHVYPELGPDRPQAATLLVVIARGREELVRAERAVLGQCAAASLVLIGLLALLTWRSVDRGLAPANRLAAELATIQAHHVPRSLDVGGLPAELQPMARTTDALIRRLDDALQRERRTSADIAHQLRTPVSELLTVAEVALRNGLDAEGSRHALGTVRTVAERMGRSISTLLKLARLEMGDERFGEGPVEIGRIVAESLRSHAALERERGLRLHNGVAPEAVVEGDQEVLRIVVSNLVSNALYYSSPGGAVELRLEHRERAWCLLVENDSGDLSPQDLPALSEPFWRKDPSRTDGNRSGLGLALSCALAAKTGSLLEFTLSAGRFQARIHGGRSGGSTGGGNGSSRSAGA